MKLKTKDILTIIISLVFIIGSTVALLKLTGKPKETQKQEINTAVEDAKNITKEIDKDTLEKVTELKDYGKPNLENIGKEDPFSPVN